MRYPINTTFPFRIRLEAQDYAIDVSQGANQMGIITITPGGSSTTLWIGDAGLSYNNPVSPITPGNIDYDKILDEVGMWEFRIIRRGDVGDYDLLRRYWVECLDLSDIRYNIKGSTIQL